MARCRRFKENDKNAKRSPGMCERRREDTLRGPSRARRAAPGRRAGGTQQPQQPLCVSGEVGGRARGEGAWGQAGHDARALRRLTRLNHSTDFTGETDSEPGRGWLPWVAEAAAALDRGLSGPQRPCSSPRPWAQCDKGSGKVKKKQT